MNGATKKNKSALHDRLAVFLWRPCHILLSACLRLAASYSELSSLAAAGG